MNYYQAFILAIIEGLSEFLPISSTAHLLLAQKFLQISDLQFAASFNIFIQLGAMCALLAYFIRDLCASKKLWGKLIATTIPTILIGTICYRLFKNYLAHANYITGIVLIGMGVVFSVLDYWWTKKTPPKNLAYLDEIKQTSYPKMMGIGVFHSLAIIPGVSRSGACSFAARGFGLSKMAATKLAFILGLPIIAGASLLDLSKEFSQLKTCSKQLNCQSVFLTSSNIYLMLFGFGVAFIVALLTAPTFIKLMANKPFWYFGLYRLFIGSLYLWAYLF